MKAAVCREFGAPLTIEEVKIAPPGPGEVLVKLAACAICHSDIMYINGGWGGDLPAIYGHEAAGIVEAVGEGVETIKPGDHGVVTLVRSCGHCHYCTRGTPVVCETEFALDVTSPLQGADGISITPGLRTGGFGEYALVHASQVVAIDKKIPLECASLLACGVLTGFGAVANTAGIEPGSDVVVVGTGGVGLNSVQAATICGAQRVIAVDTSDNKLNTARQFGATHAVNAKDDELAAKVRQLTDGRGADYVFVTVGVKPAIDSAYALMAAAGTTVLVGMPATGVMSEFDPCSVAASNQRILGSKMGSSKVQIDIPFLASLYLQGRLKLDELITGRYRLADINDAIASAKSGEALRNVIIY